jgi:hypothetical protein
MEITAMQIRGKFRPFETSKSYWYISTGIMYRAEAGETVNKQVEPVFKTSQML